MWAWLFHLGALWSIRSSLYVEVRLQLRFAVIGIKRSTCNSGCRRRSSPVRWSSRPTALQVSHPRRRRWSLMTTIPGPRCLGLRRSAGRDGHDAHDDHDDCSGNSNNRSVDEASAIAVYLFSFGVGLGFRFCSSSEPLQVLLTLAFKGFRLAAVPLRTFSVPSSTTFSPNCRPSLITQSCPNRSPTLTGLIAILLSAGPLPPLSS